MTTKTTKANVYRADLYGLREGKYTYLWENDVSTTRWEEVAPQTPFYLFAKQDAGLLEEYEQGWKITEIMPVNVLGFQTHRDKFAIDFDEDTVKHRVREMRASNLTDDELRTKYKVKDNRDWQLSKARDEVREDKNWERFLIQCLYRPFDRRYCYFSEVTMDYPRRELIDHVFEQDNLCLLSSRQQGTLGYKHAWVARQPANDCVISTRSREANQVFPLYLYPNSESATLFNQPTPNPGGRRPNLSPAFVEDMTRRLGLTFVDDGKGDLDTTFGPEDVFHYIYAVFHSPTYRERYAEFLKIDFPRVPLSSSPELFRSLVAKGETLTALHLMERCRQRDDLVPGRGGQRGG